MLMKEIKSFSIRTYTIFTKLKGTDKLSEITNNNALIANEFHINIIFFSLFRTPIPRPPRVNGREIDLHKFYSLVCSRGGWAKVWNI